MDDKKESREIMGPYCRSVAKLAIACPLQVGEFLLEKVGALTESYR